jgi:hypothetical protein
MKDKRPERRRRERHLRRRQRRRPADDAIGYVARYGMTMVCDGDACVVAGSEAAMIAILSFHQRDPAEYAIEPAYGWQLLQAIALGAAYALDEQAYRRFLPAAQQAGLPLAEEDFSDPGPTGIHLVRIGNR